MKRPWIAIAAVFVAVVVAILALVLRPSPAPPGGLPAGTAADRAFVDDSLGVRMRVPDKPEWTLVREPAARSDGRVVSANHSSGRATVRIFVRTVPPETTIDKVLAARKQEVASAFGVRDLDTAIAHVMKDEMKTVNDQTFHQWQAVTRPVEVVGEEQGTVMFMWLTSLRGNHSYEGVGMVRLPSPPKPEDEQASNALLADLAYILQSFEVR
jgi:hypothetical protein